MSASTHLLERHRHTHVDGAAPGTEMVQQQLAMDPHKLPELTTEAGQLSPKQQRKLDDMNQQQQQIIGKSKQDDDDDNDHDPDDAMMMMECEGGRSSAPAASEQISNRWPQEEAMALLNIRSSMNTSFRDSSSIKTPLWEQISRKMAEMGYRRTAKKCKEKFENMHKYYKRTKEGKTRKQTDGKHYRFFNELDAIFGAKSTSTIGSAAGIPSSASPPSSSHDPDLPVAPLPAAAGPLQLELQPPHHHNHHHHSSPSSNSTSSADTSSDPNPKPPPLQSLSMDGAASPPALHPLLLRRPKKLDMKKKTKTKKSLAMKKKYVAFFEKAMKEVMRRQEEMQERFLTALDRMEMARAEREEEWRKQEMARLSVEQDLRLHDTLVSASRDTSLIGFLHRIVSDPGGGDRPPPDDDDEEVRRLQSHSSLLSASFAANSAALSTELISILQQQINLFNSGGGAGAAAHTEATQLYRMTIPYPAGGGGFLAEAKPEHIEMATNNEHAIVPFNNANLVSLRRPRSPTTAAAIAANDELHDNRGGGGGGEDDNNSMMTEDDTSCQQDPEDKTIQPKCANINNNVGVVAAGGGGASKRWPKQEVVALISIRSELERRFRQPGSKAALWEQVSVELRSLGYDRPPKRCKEKWENINKYFKKAKDSNRSRPEDAKTCPYFHHLNALYKKSLLSTAGTGGAATANNPGAAVPNFNVSPTVEPPVNPNIHPASDRNSLPPVPNHHSTIPDNTAHDRKSFDHQSHIHDLSEISASAAVIIRHDDDGPDQSAATTTKDERHAQKSSNAINDHGYDDAEIVRIGCNSVHHQGYPSDERRGHHIRQDSALDVLAAAYPAANGN